MERWEDAPWVGWLEETLRGMVEADPVCVAIEMIDADGRVDTGYWMCDANDRAQMIRAMQDDDRMEWVKENRDAILAVLNDGDSDEEEDGEEEEGGGEAE